MTSENVSESETIKPTKAVSTIAVEDQLIDDHGDDPRERGPARVARLAVRTGCSRRCPRRAHRMPGCPALPAGGVGAGARTATGAVPPGYCRKRRRAGGGFGDGYGAARSLDASASR
ncbi:hypothetical protein OHQ89_51200 [Streptomyces canus]|uniref:hypothetical protein n=1 Tax=Streptomyces canus TaxID=58343 RepID=UPI0030DEC225